MPGEWFQRFGAVHEDYGIALIQEVFGRCRSAIASAEVVHEAYGVVLEWNCGATRRNENDITFEFEVAIAKLLQQRSIILETVRRQVGRVEFLPV